MAHQAGAYPGFSSRKRLGVFLLPPGWDASPSQGYSLALNLLVKDVQVLIYSYKGCNKSCMSILCPSSINESTWGRGGEGEGGFKCYSMLV